MTPRDIVNPTVEPVSGPYAEIGLRFRKSRLALGLTLRDACAVLHMTGVRLSELERGERPPTPGEIWKLLDYATGELHAANQTIKEMDGAV